MSTRSDEAEMLIMKGFSQVNPEYKDLAPSIRKGEIIDSFKTRANWRLEDVIKARRANGLRTNWELMTPKKVVDLVCGLDIILCPGGDKELLLGFDVTLDGAKVEDKVKTKTQILLDDAYTPLKIRKVGVIHLASLYGIELSEQDLDWDLRSTSEREALVIAVENFMYDVYEAKGGEVLATTINF